MVPKTYPPMCRYCCSCMPRTGIDATQDMSQLGGRSACYDAAAAMEALCCAPELDIANGACNGLMAAGGPAHLVRVGAGAGGSIAMVATAAHCRGSGRAPARRGAGPRWLLVIGGSLCPYVVVILRQGDVLGSYGAIPRVQQEQQGLDGGLARHP